MWAAGLPILGLKSFPTKWCMVCRDRPLQDALDTITSMGFPEEDVKIIPAFGRHAKEKYKIIEEIKRMGAKLVLWEGLDMMVRNSNNPHEVAEFLSEMSAYCEEGLTILGTTGIAKLKPHEMYTNPRQLVAGSSVWERCTSTNLIIVARNPGNVEDPRRILFACLKNEASFTVEGHFNEWGMLEFEDWEDRLTGDQLKAAIADVRGVKGRKRP